MKKISSLACKFAIHSSNARKSNSSGFTLFELLAVLVILSVFAAFAIPNYQQYMRKRDLSVAKQEALRMANELERFKSKNFSYKGFDATFAYSSYDRVNGELLLPVGATLTNAKYLLTVVDTTTKKPLTIVRTSGNETTDSQSVRGLNWVMKVVRISDSSGNPKEPLNYDLFLNSEGVRCMTKMAGSSVNNYGGCGTSSDVEVW